jgi:hypothetical protein
MDLEMLTEALDEIFPDGFLIKKDDHGQLLIYTGLQEDPDGVEELVSFVNDEEDDE